MYGGYNPTGGGSPPLPDIIGPYYAGSGYGTGGPPSTGHITDLYGGAPSLGYLYDPITSPIRRRRYSIAGLPSATMMSDYYNMYPSNSVTAFGLQTPLHHASSSNLVNLLNETHKSISRSSQILNQHARLQQTQPTKQQYPGRIISSYPTLHPGGEISPNYLNDNLLQMSASFSSQPNMYFQQYNAPSHTVTGGVTGATRDTMRPALSISNLNASTPNYSSRYNVGGLGSGSNYPYTQSLLNHSDLPYILQQRQLLSSLHASNPAISQYYQQQLPHYLQHYAQPSHGTYASQTTSHYPGSLGYNLQQQFAGTQQHAHQYAVNNFQPPSHIYHSVAQQLNPNHQFHVHSQQNHLQTHPLASLVNSSSPFGGQIANSSDSRHFLDNLHSAATSYHQVPSAQTGIQPPPTHHHHHPHIHHPTAPHTHHPPPHHMHHQHQTPFSKIDLEYPKMPHEHKRQVSFKFDVDQLSLDS